jgi:glycosyltransferase involved in cell wall biosynthesis
MGILACLAAQELSPALFEVLVVDNGSTDATAERVLAFMAAHPKCVIRYIREDVPGLLAGRHRGAREASADLLTFFDDDVELGPDFALNVLRVFADDHLVLAGGPSRPKFEAEPPDWIQRYYIRDKGRWECGPLSLLDYGDKAGKIDPGRVWGLNYSIRKKALYDFGGFHPDCLPESLLMFMGDGESGLSAKIKAKGLSAAYAPGLGVRHIVPADRLTEEYFRSRFFSQGISDSFTEIRHKKGVAEGGMTCPTPVPERKNTQEGLHARIRNAYVDGYLFHQNAARQSTTLLAWILRENYFDYAYPELEPQPEIH